MKKLKIYLLALGCIATAGLTSCLGDSDDSNQGLSKQQIGQCLMITEGTYSGKMLFAAKNPNDSNDTIDTLDVKWKVTPDTLVVLNHFPTAVFRDAVSDKDLKEALSDSQPQQLKAYIGFYQTSPISFLLAPQKVDYDVEYRGKSHVASVVFWVNSYSFGYYDSKDEQFRMQLSIAALFLDNDESRNYLSDISTGTASIPVIITNADLSK